MIALAVLLTTLVLEPASQGPGPTAIERPTPELGSDASEEAAIWAEAAALVEARELERAADRFEPLAEAYPQDYAIQLEAAYLAFLAGDYPTAEARYTTAIALSSGAAIARAGLAWTHLRQGHDRQARAEFEALLVDAPGLAAAEDGLAELRRRRFVISPIVFGIGHVYANHPTLARAGGVSVSVPMQIARHLLVTGGYGYARFTPTAPGAQTRAGSDSGNGSGGSSGSGGSGTSVGPGRATSDTGDVGFDQHLAHFGIGGAWAKAGFLAQYAYLHDASLLANHAHAIGLSLRYSPWGDLILDASATAFAGAGWVGRLAPSWRVPATAWLDLRPGVGLQLVDGELLPSGFASIRFHGRVGSLSFGGKGGLEERPVYLETPAIFAFAGRIPWGAWFAGEAELSRGVHLLASYEIHGLRAPSADGLVLAQAHYFGLGLRWRSSERQP